MAFVCNHGPSTSHHSCNANFQLPGPVPPQLQPLPVHHCETESSHSAYCSSCQPPATAPPHPLQCTCCNHGPAGHPPSSPLPLTSSNWCPPPPTLSHPHSHSHTPTSHHSHSHPDTPTPHHPNSHPHTPTSHHPHSHLHTPPSHPPSHPHTPTSHPPSHPHTPTSHPPSHPNTPTSHPPSHPHISTSHHPPSSHTSCHSPHPHQPPSSHRHIYHPSPAHHPTTHIHVHRPPFTASPLHHAHTYHQSHSSSPAFHSSHHGTETHQSPSGCCTSSSAYRILPPQHPKSVCQVHPTRRQLIPAEGVCFEGSDEDHSSMMPQFVAESPTLHPSQCSDGHRSVPHSPISSYARPLPQNEEEGVFGAGVTPHTPEYRVGVAPQLASKEHGTAVYSDALTTNHTPVVPTPVYSTPPPNPHNSRIHRHTLEFSPYDGRESLQSGFELAAAASVLNSAAKVGIPVNQVPTSEPSVHQLSSLPGSSGLDDLPNSFPSSSPRLHTPVTTPLSSPLSSRANQIAGSNPPLPGIKKKMKKKNRVLHMSLNATSSESAPLVKPFSTLFACDEKIGKEAVVLQHCTSRNWKPDPALATHSTKSSALWEESEKKHTKESHTDETVARCSSSSDLWYVVVGDTKTEITEEEGLTEHSTMEIEHNRATTTGHGSEMAASVGEVDGGTDVGWIRMTRSRTKLISDSELSQSETETGPVHTSRGKGKKRASEVKKEGGSGDVGGGEASENDDGVDVVAVAESENEALNQTLVPVKRERRSPVSMRTRSRTQTDSSQSDSDLPSADEMILRRRKRSTKRSIVVETSESESSVVGVLPAAQQKQQRIKGESKQQQWMKGESKQQQTVQLASQQPLEETSTVQDIPTSSVPRLMDSSVRDPAGIPEVTLSASSGATTARVILSDWYIRIVGKNLVIVEGIKNDDKKRTWHSGPIMKRVSPRQVATRSGTIYQLEGPLSRAGLEKLDIGELAAQFEDGFPENWLSVIHECLLRKIKFNKEKEAARKGTEEKREEERAEEAVTEPGGGEVRGEEAESDCSDVVRRKTRTRTRTSRWRRKQPVTEDSASDRCEEAVDDEAERGRRMIVTSTPSTVLQASATEASTNDERAVTPSPHFKTELLEEGEGVTTPQSATNPASSFISSLKRSSRGRTLKPASSSLVANTSMSIYSYDMRGNFIGLSSPVIDLTVSPSDTSGFLASGNESVLTTPRPVKREPHSENNGEGPEGMVGGGREEGKVTGRTGAMRVGKRGSVDGSQKGRSVRDVVREGQKKQRRRKSHSIIPLALRKTKKSIAQEVVSEQEEDASGETEEEKAVSGYCEEETTAVAVLEEERERGEDLVVRTNHSDPGTVLTTTGEKEHDNSEIENERGKMLSDSRSIGKGVMSAEVEGDFDAHRVGEVKKDCLVDNLKIAGGVGCVVTNVKVRHKVAKKRVCISDEVTVMGGCGEEGMRGSGERRRDEKWKERGEVEWSATELKKLSKVVMSVPALADNFWEMVAQGLDNGRSADECGREYSKLRERRKKKKKVSHGTGREKTAPHKDGPPPALTAKVGTMKRKRQVRDILDHLDSGHSDDCFSSTPFKKSKFRTNMEREEEGEGDDLLLTTPHEVLRQRVCVTDTPTLCNYGTTPDYKGGHTQSAADHVIYKQQKVKKIPPKKLPTSKSVSSKHSSKSQQRRKTAKPSTTRPDQLHGICGGDLSVLRRFEDSEDSSDSNPFSDMEDACHDVIARLH